MKKTSKEKQKIHDEIVSKLNKQYSGMKDVLYKQHKDWKIVFADEALSRALRDFRRAYNRCPECLSSNTRCENFDQMWGDGDVVCQDCRTFVRYFDSG